MLKQQSNTYSDNFNYQTQVHDEKYKKFDGESSHNQLAQPLNLSAYQFYSNYNQSKPLQKADMNQKDPQFIAIPINQSSNQQINTSHTPQNNINHYQEEKLEQNLVNLNSSEIFLKDLNFTKQSQHALLSLLLLVIQHICLLLGVSYVFALLQRSITDTSPQFLFIYVPLYLMVLFLSNSNFFRKFPFSLLLYFLNILLTSLIIFYFCTLFSRQMKEDKFSVTDYDSAAICCYLMIPLNTLEIIVIMIYLCVENRKVQFIIILPILLLIYNFFLVLQIKLYVILIPSFLYGVLLLNTINQSFKGRFRLKQGQILSTINSYNFGIIIPFKFWRF